MGFVEFQKNQIMLLGGCDSTEQKVSRSCYFYNRQKKTATVNLKMQRRRYNFAVVNMKNFIYVFGGHDSSENKWMVQCERFNVLTQKWQEIQRMSTSKVRPKAEILKNEKIVVFG